MMLGGLRPAKTAGFVRTMAGLTAGLLLGLSTMSAAQAAGSQQQELATLGDENVLKTADYVFVEKGKRQLTLWRDGWLLASFPIRLGRTPVGAKRTEGDGRTPEGVYTIDFRKNDSNYYRALHISYPSPEDVAQAQRKGARPGGAIMIHGLPNEADKDAAKRIHKYVDWTEGCIAMTDTEIDQVWQMVPVGTPIEIVP